MTERRCSRCEEHKPVDVFPPVRKPEGVRLHCWCRPCLAAARREDRARRPDHYSEISKRQWNKDKDAVLERHRASYHRNREQRVAKMRQRTPEQLAAYNAQRRAKIASDPEYAAKVAERNRLTADRNREKYNAQRRDAWKSAPAQKRLRTYFTSAICHSLKGTGKGGRSWEAILGYSSDDLRAHLERQFAKGMSWDNYGEWHVDHIVPVASFEFDSADHPDFAACWSLTNLQPLWARDNIAKRAKRVTLL